MTQSVILDAPTELLGLIAQRTAARRPRSETPSNVELDTPLALRRAEQIIAETPGAIKGGRGHNTLKLTLRLRDAGLSEWTCVELLDRLWAGKCAPPLALGPTDDDDQGIETIVENAYRYAQNAAASATPEVAFASVKFTPPVYTAPLPTPETVASQYQAFESDPIDDDDRPIAPRRWVYGRTLVRGYVSEFVAHGGVGKTAFSMGVAMSIALNRALLAKSQNDYRHRVHKSGPVVLLNLEDGADEMRRRLRALRLHYRISAAEIEGKIMGKSGRNWPLKVAVREGNQIAQSRLVAELVADLRRKGAVLLIVDPLVLAHGAKENDNDEMAVVLQIFSQIAEDADVAVLLIHHARKGGGSDGDASRGASSNHGGVRKMETLVVMGLDEAKQFGIAAEKRLAYIRINDAKNNMAPSALNADWFKLVSVNLRNGTPEYPHGDDIQVVEPWQPPSGYDSIGIDTMRAILNEIDAGPREGEKYLYGRKAKEEWVGRPICDATGFTEEEAQQRIKTWRDDGLLTEGTYNSPSRHRHLTAYAAVNWGAVNLRLSPPDAPSQEED